ncbi:GNAT family N-acetyltransferase [Kaistia geumhonensis]|nr:GNAT family N-acetyltransferase [Kaistia geumhonensis]MCX5481255.1 GNAT family N-acetyltransferase [Kaistia geumhonensis]
MGDVSIRLAGQEDRPVVECLIQLYLYDMTDIFHFPIGPDGRFEYDFLDRFWRRPYLIAWRGELAGFVLVIDESPITGATDRQFVAEFFVLRAYRGRGVGAQAFREVLRANPGRWQIGVMERNLAASAFWRSVTTAYAPEAFSQQFDGEHWRVYEFETAPCL